MLMTVFINLAAVVLVCTVLSTLCVCVYGRVFKCMCKRLSVCVCAFACKCA